MRYMISLCGNRRGTVRRLVAALRPPVLLAQPTINASVSYSDVLPLSESIMLNEVIYARRL